MSKVPLLDSQEKILSWKEGFRALLRQCGKQQQEVAIEMALSLANADEQVRETAFISSLSRFVNGRDSAFPSWFYKESTRLLPLAKAMGLSSTAPLWDLLHRVTNKSLPQVSWHPAFPTLQLYIPVTLSGHRLEDIVEKVRAYGRRNMGDIAVVLYGWRKSGKATLATHLRQIFDRVAPTIAHRIVIELHITKPSQLQTPFPQPYFAQNSLIYMGIT